MLPRQDAHVPTGYRRILLRTIRFSSDNLRIRGLWYYVDIHRGVNSLDGRHQFGSNNILQSDELWGSHFSSGEVAL